jgi:prepilin-type N-terminal cleavage/methylation domain-containing protein
MHPAKLPSRRRGLTLIEVMVALGVLVILVSGIFLIVQTSLKTVLSIDNQASRLDEITNITDILRSGFRNLPPQARLRGLSLSEGTVKEHLLIVRNAPGFLSWLSESEAENTVVLLSIRQDDEDSGWRICLKRFAPPKNLSEEDFDPKNLLRAGAKIPWLELVGDFSETGARFFDQETRLWKDQWTDTRTRPGLIQFILVSEIVRDARSAAPIFWVPPVKGDSV